MKQLGLTIVALLLIGAAPRLAAPALAQSTIVTGLGLTGDGSAGSPVAINPSAVRTYIAGSASLSHGTMAANGGCSSQSMSITGAVINDKLVIGPPSELLTYNLVMIAAISQADTVTVRLCNFTPASITVPSGWTWNVDVVKSF